MIELSAALVNSRHQSSSNTKTDDKYVRLILENGHVCLSDVSIVVRCG